ncbi:hypothetical protein JQ662_000247 [Listeria monocytogenes]|nr:hypothetical protein [Listeria monocytogenes]
MAQYIGFRRAYFGILDENDKVTEIIIIEGNPEKGATVQVSVSGLTKETSKTKASDKTYFISGGGLGEVESSLSILDLRPEHKQKILGFDGTIEGLENIEGLSALGSGTNAPYVASVFESRGLNGEMALMALPKGKFRMDEVSFETQTDDPDEPEATELTGSHEERDDLGKGYIDFIGSKADGQKIIDKVLMKTTPQPDPENKSAKKAA